MAGGNPLVTPTTSTAPTFPPAIVDAALDAGLSALGENYAQELLEKVGRQVRCGSAAEVGPASSDPVRWQFIGALQRNKVRQLAPYVHRWQSIDRPALVDELARRAPHARLLVQVNTTGEPRKAGCAPADVGPLVERAMAADLVVEGLMTVGPTDPHVSPLTSFRLLRDLVDRHGLRWLSLIHI